MFDLVSQSGFDDKLRFFLLEKFINDKTYSLNILPDRNLLNTISIFLESNKISENFIARAAIVRFAESTREDDFSPKFEEFWRKIAEIKSSNVLECVSLAALEALLKKYFSCKHVDRKVPSSVKSLLLAATHSHDVFRYKLYLLRRVLLCQPNFPANWATKWLFSSVDLVDLGFTDLFVECVGLAQGWVLHSKSSLWVSFSSGLLTQMGALCDYIEDDCHDISHVFLPVTVQSHCIFASLVRTGHAIHLLSSMYSHLLRYVQYMPSTCSTLHKVLSVVDCCVSTCKYVMTKPTVDDDLKEAVSLEILQGSSLILGALIDRFPSSIIIHADSVNYTLIEFLQLFSPNCSPHLNIVFNLAAIWVENMGVLSRFQDVIGLFFSLVSSVVTHVGVGDNVCQKKDKRTKMTAKMEFDENARQKNDKRTKMTAKIIPVEIFDLIASCFTLLWHKLDCKFVRSIYDLCIPYVIQMRKEYASTGMFEPPYHLHENRTAIYKALFSFKYTLDVLDCRYLLISIFTEASLSDPTISYFAKECCSQLQNHGLSLGLSASYYLTEETAQNAMEVVDESVKQSNVENNSVGDGQTDESKVCEDESEFNMKSLTVVEDEKNEREILSVPDHEIVPPSSKRVKFDFTTDELDSVIMKLGVIDSIDEYEKSNEKDSGFVDELTDDIQAMIDTFVPFVNEED